MLDIRDIERILPHRYPFLLVDHVDEIGEERIVARKLVSRNEPHFNGHFPGYPVMPGVLIIEALAQAGALYAAKLVKFDPEKQVIYFMAIDKAKFRRPVVPGDVLRLEVVPLRKGGAIWKMRGEAKVGEIVVCEAEFMASIQQRPAEGGSTARPAEGGSTARPAEGGSTARPAEGGSTVASTTGER
ncbi:MAG TPA: 3-hydroxyacyl-ACP dehydratase FabZ [Polyangia bacterium]|nr:3-hydroxyacyl-ACP dehydratase FabZ [Polyangia bacterium]